MSYSGAYASGVFSSKPTSPVAGQLYFATDLGNGLLIEYTGSKWIPIGGVGRILFDMTYHSGAGNAAETNYYVATIPSGLLSSTGGLRVYGQGQYTGTTGTKTGIWRISSSSGDTSGGTVIVSSANGGSNTALSASWEKTIFNNNSASAQIFLPTGSTGYGNTSSTAALVSASINTANVWYINFNMTGNASDTVGYQGIIIEWIES